MEFSTLHLNPSKEIVTKRKVARRKLGLLELVTELSNISKACQLMGYSRQQFTIRRDFQPIRAAT